MSYRLRMTLLLVALLLLLAISAADEAQLVLIDGSVLTGTEVRREDNSYVLTLEDGDQVTLPEELVEIVRLVGEEEPSPWDEGRIAGDAVPPGPTGLRNAGPETLAGEPVEAPRTEDQLRALGRPSSFQKSIIDPTWTPESAWDEDEDVLAGSRSTFRKDIVDSSWQPKSAWDAGKDVMAGSRTKWKKSVIDSSWKPTDGFKNSVGNR
jgi:hypothetical protein